jgi:hypothetical protein
VKGGNKIGATACCENIQLASGRTRGPLFDPTAWMSREAAPYQNYPTGRVQGILNVTMRFYSQPYKDIP